MTRRLLTLLAIVVVASTIAWTASADDLISVPDCYTINPNPEFLSCSQYTEPYTEVLANLPYDTVPEYTQCVRERCVCTGEQTDIDNTTWQTDGMYCSTLGWNESGTISCNAMVECMKSFWKCTLDALMDRDSTNKANLDANENATVQEIVKHGQVPGQNFEETDMFLSCRMIMCEAAASRKNCGLLTCIPNNTQCYEYIKPPPLPDVHQLCTQGCRAVLILMALTITTFTSAVMCCACCPSPVIENQPLITGEDEGNKEKQRRRDSDAPDSNFDIASQGGGAVDDGADGAQHNDEARN